MYERLLKTVNRLTGGAGHTRVTHLKVIKLIERVRAMTTILRPKKCRTNSFGLCSSFASVGAWPTQDVRVLVSLLLIVQEAMGQKRHCLTLKHMEKQRAWLFVIGCVDLKCIFKGIYARAVYFNPDKPNTITAFMEMYNVYKCIMNVLYILILHP